MSGDWLLDEMAYAGTEHLDPGYVAGYEEKAAFDPTDDVELLRACGLSRTSAVLDMGAGTGVFARAVAPLCRRVIAVEPSPAMVRFLRARVEAQGPDNLEIVQAGFLSYEHAGPPVDFAFTRNALHQIPDFWKGLALSRLASLVRRGGVLRLRDLIFDFDPPDAESRLEDWFAGAVTDPLVGYTALELATHVRTEFSTYSWLFDVMLERVGFSIRDRIYRRSVYGAYTCVRY